MTTARNDPRSGSVISTMMAVLRCFDSEHRHLGVVEIAEGTGLHKSSISRLMTTLEAERLVERDPVTRRYSLGLGLLSVAGTLLADLDVRRAAYPVLVELAQRTDESCSLMIWTGEESVCVEQVASSQTIKHTTAIGTSYSTTASSSVRTFLAELGRAEVEALLTGSRLKLQGHRSARQLHEDLARVVRDGVAINDGDTDPAEVGVSAVVRDHRGVAVATVLVSAPRYRTDADRVAALAQDCRWAAAQITRGLGGATRARVSPA